MWYVTSEEVRSYLRYVLNVCEALSFRLLSIGVSAVFASFFCISCVEVAISNERSLDEI